MGAARTLSPLRPLGIIVDMLMAIVIGIHIVVSLFLVLFVLLHSGKGGGLSDMFGGGGSLSGGTSIERNLDRITVATALIFALTTFILAWQWE
ncbi:MAG TPA: preprotein translocase subunit SecG [Actinomycetota bacterium]|nr:preprotein translocase subunit SecG [Actinomycetota bacterium]